jgi:tetratricopeptide (TPR) repeat protein
MIRLASLLAVILSGYSASAQLVSLDPAALPIPSPARAKLTTHLATGDWLAIESVLFQHVRQTPDSAELRKALAAAHFRLGRHLLAAAEYARAARLQPLDPASRFTLAAAYVALDRRHWARRELEALAAAYPRNPLYPHWLAGIYQHYQWFDVAILESRKAIALNPEFAAAHDRLGQCFEALGRNPEALAAYAKAEQLGRAAGDPSPWPSFHLGSLFRQTGSLPEALEALHRAAALDPGHSHTWHELGLTLDALHRLPEALAALESSVRLDPANPKFLYALSRLQRKMGHDEAAQDSMQRFRRLTNQ